MSNLEVKWEKGVRTWRQRAQARALIAAARAAGRTGPACLITNLAQMGDVVLCAGVAAVLRARLPQSPLLFAAQPRWHGALEGDPALDGVLDAQSLYEIRALARSGLFETVYVLDVPIPTLLNYLDGVPHIFRYAPPTTGDWFSHGKNLIAFYEQNAGLSEGEAGPRLWLRPEDRQFAETLFAEQGLAGRGPVIALHTHSSMESKNWPLERWAALVTRWVAMRGAHFLVLGGPGEASALASLPGVTSLVGQLTLKQTAAVIARSDFFLGLDSGLAYVAEAVGTPGLVVLGSTVTETSGPRDHALFSSVRAPGACLPACHRACDREPLCITALSVDAVDAALQAAWERTRKGEPSCACP